MIIYNVTISIEEEIKQDWIQWMKEDHIPEVMATNLFADYKLCKVISVPGEDNTYSIQYFCDNISSYNNYQDNYATELQQKHKDKFQNQFVAFRTILEVL